MNKIEFYNDGQYQNNGYISQSRNFTEQYNQSERSMKTEKTN